MPTYAIKFRSSLKDGLFVALFGFALLALGAEVALLLWRLPAIGETQSAIALHYNVFFGVDRVGDWRLAFVAPVFGVIILIANFIIGTALHAQERFVSRAIAAMTLIVNVLLGLGSLFVILANI